MFESRGAHFLFVAGRHHARTREPLLSITGPKITIWPDSTQGRQAPVPLDRLPPAPAGSADDAPGTARRAVAAMVRALNDLLAPVISQLEALRQAGSTSDSLRRSREPARRRIAGDLHAWRSCPGPVPADGPIRTSRVLLRASGGYRLRCQSRLVAAP